MNIKLKTLDHDSVKPYGYIIDRKCTFNDGKSRNDFGIVVKARSKGWRIAYLVVKEHSIEKLECHPDSMESFEPVKGRGVIVLALAKAPEKYEIFLLDKPIILKKGVWHNVAALSREWEVKICENLTVKEVYKNVTPCIKLR